MKLINQFFKNKNEFGTIKSIIVLRYHIMVSKNNIRILLSNDSKDQEKSDAINYLLDHFNLSFSIGELHEIYDKLRRYVKIAKYFYDNAVHYSIIN